MSGLFHLASCFQGSSKLRRVELHSFSWMGNISLPGFTIFGYPFISDGHLHYFYLLAIVNIASRSEQVSEGEQVSEDLSLFWGCIYLGVELLSHMVTPCWNF